MAYFDYDKYTGKKEEPEEKKTSSGFFDYEKYTRGTPMIEPGGKNIFESIRDIQEQAESRPKVQPEPPKELPGRDIPVIGPVLRGLDVFQKATEPAAKIAERFYTPGAGPTAVSGIARGVGSVVSRLAPRIGLGTGVGAKVAREAIKEGVTGVPVGVGQTLSSNPGASNKELAEGAALGAGFGAVGGAAIPALGKAAKTIADRAGLTDKLTSFVSRSRSVNPEAEKATREMLQSRKLGVASGPLRNASNEQYINKVMSDIRPTVNERMTPPLENPNELAKWLQPHLDTSLNQIRKLPYDDLVELANEVKSHMSMYDVAKNVAKERGYNLDDILSNKTPSIGQSAERLRMGRVAGAVEPPSKNVRVAVSPEYSPSVPESGITPRPLPQEPSSQSLGISALAKKPGAYENVSTSTKSQLVTRQMKEKQPLKARANKFYTDIVDDLHPLNLFDKAVEKITGRSLRNSNRSHTLALNTRGSDVIARQILTAKQVDADGNVIGKSLKDILSQLPKNERSYVDFEDYLVNRHAITRMEKRGERVYRESLNWTPDVGRQIVADYEAAHPEFKKMADEIYQFQTNMAQTWLVDTGLLPQKVVDAWLAENPTYIPNKRFFSELEKGGGLKGGKKRGFGNQKAPVKEYTKGGSERKIISPIEAMIENVDAFVKAAKRNEVMQVVAKNLEKDPEALDAFAEFVPEEQIAGAKSLKGLNEALKEDGIEGVIAMLGEDFDSAFRKATQRGLDKDNIVRVMIGGEPKYIQINDKPLLEAITAMGPDASNVVMDFLGKVTSVFKTLTTGANPIFSLTRNIARDIPQAYVASKSTGNPLRFLSDLAESAYAIATNKELYQQYKNLGGGHSSPTAADRNLLAQTKRQILPQRGNKLKGIVPRGYDALQNALNAVESAPRLGEFKRVGRDQAGVAAAQDVTTNFKRRGKYGKQFDKVFPYFNAAIQGLDKVARIFKSNPAAAVAKSIMAVSLPSMISYAINYDNPDYQKVSKRTKDNFYLLPKGDGTFHRIAKPKELGTVFADIPERLLQLFAQQDPDAFRDFADQIRTTFLPPGIQGAAKTGGIPDRLAGALGDTVVGPIADVAANKNFAGAPIVPGNLVHLSPELQSDARTTVISKKIGEATGTSPKMLDYLFRQYTGVLGQIGQPLLSPGGSLGNSLVRQVTVDPVFSNDVIDKFYEAKGKLDQAKTDSKVTGKLPEGYSDRLRKYLGRVSDDMSSIRTKMRAIEADDSIPAAQKRKQLRQLQEQINQLASQGNAAVSEGR